MSNSTQPAPPPEKFAVTIAHKGGLKTRLESADGFKVPPDWIQAFNHGGRAVFANPAMVELVEVKRLPPMAVVDDCDDFLADCAAVAGRVGILGS